jgi:hypothetical protein
MKQIKLRSSGKLHVPNDGTGVDVEAAKEILRDAKNNRLAVLESALVIEGHLECIIAHFFIPQSSDKKTALQALILGSEWCSFSAKRKTGRAYCQ